MVKDDNCSGEKKVGNLGGSAKSSITFQQIEADTDSTYRIKLFYASGDQRNVTLWVNGTNEQILNLPSTGSYHTLRCAYIDVQLHAGVNTLTLGGTDYAPDIDRIGIMPISPMSYTKIEAESGVLSGGAYVSEADACSNGKKVSYLGMGGELALGNIHIEAEGRYLVRIYYSTGDNRTLMISANGNPALSAICFDSGSFDALEYKEILLDLAEGDNTLQLFNSSGYAPDLDYIQISSVPIA